VPQIEVSFDIDANGILNVSAKDLGTSKEQTVRIEQSAGLSEEDIDKMRSEAEAHAAEDKKQRELVELRNQADSMCWQLDKLLKEHEDKLSDADKQAIKTSMDKVKEVAKGNDSEAIKSALNELEQASHALSKRLYEAAGAQAGPGPGAGQPGGDGGAQGGEGSGGDDDTIDAEFEVKDS
jgi:molecular chaperone DnaK